MLHSLSVTTRSEDFAGHLVCQDHSHPADLERIAKDKKTEIVTYVTTQETFAERDRLDEESAPSRIDERNGQRRRLMIRLRRSSRDILPQKRLCEHAPPTKNSASPPQTLSPVHMHA